MVYNIKNKLISFGGSSTVKDEEGNDLYIVKGRVFTFTRFKTITTMDGTPLYKVRNKFFTFFLPKVYVMDADGNRLLTIKKEKLFSFQQNFEIIPEEGSDLNIKIQGDFFGWDFVILENGYPVAHVGRKLNIVDSFWLETDDEDRAPFYIALVIALDNYYDKVRER